MLAFAWVVLPVSLDLNPKSKFMGRKDARVDAYLANAPEYAKPILEHLRALVHDTCPDVEETWKWSFPVFMYHGAIMCNMAAFKQHCAFGFWKGALIQDDDKILETTDKSVMGNLGSLKSLKDLPADRILKKYLKIAMRLNEDDIKVPKKPKPTEQDKKELAVPDYFQKVLKTNKAAQKAFDAFSYSHKKEYIQWFEEAKTEPTREKRMTQALEWIAEGKGRNWKYQKC